LTILEVNIFQAFTQQQLIQIPNYPFPMEHTPGSRQKRHNGCASAGNPLQAMISGK